MLLGQGDSDGDECEESGDSELHCCGYKVVDVRNDQCLDLSDVRRVKTRWEEAAMIYVAAYTHKQCAEVPFSKLYRHRVPAEQVWGWGVSDTATCINYLCFRSMVDAVWLDRNLAWK
jgi:hypothetical protein